MFKKIESGHLNKNKLAALFFGFLMLTFESFWISSSVQAVEIDCGTKPANIVLMLDRTSSVNNEERVAEKDAAIAFIQKVQSSNKESKIALGRFGKDDAGSNFGQAEIFQPLVKVDGNLDKLKKALEDNLGAKVKGSSGTNIKSALQLSRNALLENGKLSSNAFIVLLSDGDANRFCTVDDCSQGKVDKKDENGAKTAAVEEGKKIRGEGVKIITIAYDASGAGNDASFNRPTLASIATQPSQDDTKDAVDAAERDKENSDGDHFFISINPQDISSVLEKVLQEVILCDDQNSCTVDRCNENNKCEFTQKDTRECTGNRCTKQADCDDGNPCNGIETCDANGACAAGSTLDCDDHVPCTKDSCDAQGKCQHETPNPSCDVANPPEDDERDASDDPDLWVLEGSGGVGGCSMSSLSSFTWVNSFWNSFAALPLLLFIWKRKEKKK